MKKNFCRRIVLNPFSFCIAQNVGINFISAAPVASGMLNIQAIDKALLIPKSSR